jgi:stringent starvation protein B
MVHPVQSVIESLYAAGRCPRLHVNALFEGVVCPDFIREQWQERLIIDLDSTYPLDLTFEEEYLSADLSFGGYVTRCTFPWGAVYVVADRSTGRGIVLDQNMPESVKRSRYEKNGRGSPPTKPELRSVGDDPATGIAPAEAAEAEDEVPDVGDKPAEDEAQKRRAAFKVIDGGD